MDAKVLISLVSVAFGWLLAQGTALAKDWWIAHKTRRGLLTELEDIQDQLQRVLLIHARHLQIYALKGIEPTSSLPILNMFFLQYFKEAFSHLNREQRISFQLIHASLEDLNKKTTSLAGYLQDFYKERQVPPDEKKILTTIEVWGEMVIAIYKTARDIQWHIAYHLNHPDSPSFDLMGPMHESYVKFQQELDDEVKAIINKAKSLKREDFLKIYDERLFVNSPASD